MTGLVVACYPKPFAAVFFVISPCGEIPIGVMKASFEVKKGISLLTKTFLDDTISIISFSSHCYILDGSCSLKSYETTSHRIESWGCEFSTSSRIIPQEQNYSDQKE
ncbi:hypothetical protein LXL04_014639 [Taraxacum kok-saghyz]